MHVFRNNTMFPEWTGYECYKINQLNINKMDGHSRGHQEDARRNGIVEFIENIQNFQPIEEHQSNYLDHENGTTILS